MAFVNMRFTMVTRYPTKMWKTLPDQPGVYRIVNTKTGDYYVGASLSLRHRLQGHLKSLQEASHPGKIFMRHWVLHGEESFVCEIIRTSKKMTKKSLSKIEKENIDEGATYNTTSKPRPLQDTMILSVRIPKDFFYKFKARLLQERRSFAGFLERAVVELDPITDEESQTGRKIRSITIRIDDDLYWAAKKAAAKEHISLNEFIAKLITNSTPR